MSGMLLDGDRTSGQDVRTQNVTAAMAIANIVKSSLGPVGLDKMLVDEVHSLTHSLTHSLIYLNTFSLIYSLTYLFEYLRNVYCLTCSLTHWVIWSIG
jgi:hypothetical protein